MAGKPSDGLAQNGAGALSRQHAVYLYLDKTMHCPNNRGQTALMESPRLLHVKRSLVLPSKRAAREWIPSGLTNRRYLRLIAPRSQLR
jgi:hypothetical protein